MSTRSIIASSINGQTTGIYCHFDGYESHHAPILRNYSEADARALIALGSISQLAERVAPREGESHSYRSPVDGVVVAYHRDRGEDLYPARVCTKETACQEEYVYLFDVARGVWTWRAERSNEWTDLAPFVGEAI